MGPGCGTLCFLDEDDDDDDYEDGDDDDEGDENDDHGDVIRMMTMMMTMMMLMIVEQSRDGKSQLSLLFLWRGQFPCGPLRTDCLQIKSPTNDSL